jgi:bifunctional enzyme CysN/CysC
MRRVTELASLFVDAGLITLVSPFRSDRDLARILPVSSSRSTSQHHYRIVRAGIDQPYEAPAAPEITIHTITISADAARELIVSYLREHHRL